MKVLIVGSGGREHAIAWKLRQDDPSIELHAAPGNPGIAELATCHAVSVSDLGALATLAERMHIDLTVVGPEAPLAAGIGDVFRARGLRVFGPSAAAAKIESSKRFAKELMLGAGIPTGNASWHSDVESAKRAVRVLGAPVVIKASGLAAGKGVVVCQTVAEADRTVESMLREHAFGDAGSEVLVEEFLEGEELSVFALTDGTNFRLMLPAQDHKRLLDGDRGPNTGGMGAYAPVSIARAELVADVAGGIIGPTLRTMREHGSPFAGLLYCGLMLTSSGPKVIEFNCRFGDPETQVVVPLLRTPLGDLLWRCSEPDGMSGAPELEFHDACAVTTVVAAPGYPESPRTGARITLPEHESQVVVFHAGTKLDRDGVLLTAGGRVVAVTAVADSFDEAQRTSVEAAGRVQFDGAQYRRDIGWRELGRRAGAA